MRTGRAKAALTLVLATLAGPATAHSAPQPGPTRIDGTLTIAGGHSLASDGLGALGGDGRTYVSDYVEGSRGDLLASYVPKNRSFSLELGDGIGKVVCADPESHIFFEDDHTSGQWWGSQAVVGTANIWCRQSRSNPVYVVRYPGARSYPAGTYEAGEDCVTARRTADGGYEISPGVRDSTTVPLEPKPLVINEPTTTVCEPAVYEVNFGRGGQRTETNRGVRPVSFDVTFTPET